MKPINLTASEGNWRLFMLRGQDKKFENYKNKVLARDSYTCCFCGFKSKERLSIVNLDNNYTNNKLSNMASACTLCTQCFFIESIGQSDFGGGNLILLPEINQGQLNALCHVLFAQMVLGTNNESYAKSVYRGLKLRAQSIEKQLGEGMSQPSVYGRVLVECSQPEAKQLHNNYTQQMRLLPAIHRFTLDIQHSCIASIDKMR